MKAYSGPPLFDSAVRSGGRGLRPRIQERADFVEGCLRGNKCVAKGASLPEKNFITGYRGGGGKRRKEA